MGKRSWPAYQSRLVPRTAPNEVCFFSRSWQLRRAGPAQPITTTWRSLHPSVGVKHILGDHPATIRRWRGRQVFFLSSYLRLTKRRGSFSRVHLNVSIFVSPLKKERSILTATPVCLYKDLWFVNNARVRSVSNIKWVSKQISVGGVSRMYVCYTNSVSHQEHCRVVLSLYKRHI